MGWRLARSIAALEEQILDGYGRVAWLGTKGDANHSPSSDHNGGGVTDGDGTDVVRAFDIRHLGGGPDCHALAAELMRDRRLDGGGYLIFDRKIWNPDRDQPGRWRAYSGSSPHTGHMHVSVSKRRQLYDDGAAWAIDGTTGGEGDMAKRGDTGALVGELMDTLNYFADHWDINPGWYPLVKDEPQPIYGPKVSRAVAQVKKEVSWSEGDGDTAHPNFVARAEAIGRNDHRHKTRWDAIAKLRSRTDTLEQAAVSVGGQDRIGRLEAARTAFEDRLDALDRIHPDGAHVGQTPPDPDGGFGIPDGYELADALVFIAATG